MKSIKIILIFLSVILISHINYSIDTVSTKYLPLQVGNVWVYNYIGPGNTGRDRIKITGTQISNGHIYYIFQMDGGECTCTVYTHSPFLTLLSPVRIDSTNGNLEFYGSTNQCPWGNNEHLLDSLGRTHVIQFVGDTIGGVNSCNITVLEDTTQQLIFGTYHKVKNMAYIINMVGYDRIYAKNVGLISSYQGCYYNFSCGYTLQGCVINGILYGDTGGVPVGVKPGSSEIPDEFSLFQNYPNPFNPVTQIEYQLPSKEFVNLTVYDVLGNETALLVNEEQNPGTYKVEWNGSNFPSGIYFYKLQAGDFTQTRKMTLIK